MCFDYEFTSFVNSLVNSTSQDPGWVRVNKIPLDYRYVDVSGLPSFGSLSDFITYLRYYFTNKFMNPVCDLLEPLVKNRDAVFGEFMSSKRKVCWDAKQRKINDIFGKK